MTPLLPQAIPTTGGRSDRDDALLVQFLDWCARVELRRRKQEREEQQQQNQRQQQQREQNWQDRQEETAHAAPAR